MAQKSGSTTERLEFRNKKLKENLAEKKKEVVELQLKLETANKTIDHLQSELERLKKNNVQPDKANDGYQDGWTWISKIVFTVAQASKPLRSANIIAALVLRETALSKKENKEKFISLFINAAVRYKRISTYKLKGVRGYYYCLPEWMDNKQELLPEIKKEIY